MKVYLNGIEYKTYREILKGLGVRFGCLNYEYIWCRTPRLNFSEEFSYFEDLIATSGGLSSSYALDDYVEFLNAYAEYFSFALAPYPLEECSVKILSYYKEAPTNEYYINTWDLTKPFAKKRFKEDAEKGAIIHGVETNIPFVSSCNMGTWMRGKAGWVSHFDKRKKIVVHQTPYVASAFARELLVEGYDIDLNKVKRGNWKEVAKVNCIAWKKYQDYKEISNEMA
jgi:hypothetical protein